MSIFATPKLHIYISPVSMVETITILLLLDASILWRDHKKKSLASLLDMVEI